MLGLGLVLGFARSAVAPEKRHTAAIIAASGSSLVERFAADTFAADGSTWAGSLGVATAVATTANRFTKAVGTAQNRAIVQSTAAANDRRLLCTLPRKVLEVWLVCRAEALPFTNYRTAVMTHSGTTSELRAFTGNLNGSAWYPVPFQSAIARDGVASSDVTAGWHVYRRAFATAPGVARDVSIGNDIESSGSRTWLGDIAEILLFDSVTSSDRAEALLTELRAYYGTP